MTYFYPKSEGGLSGQDQVMCKNSAAHRFCLRVDIAHIFVKLFKSAIFERILAFFFRTDLSKMHSETLLTHKINK